MWLEIKSLDKILCGGKNKHLLNTYMSQTLFCFYCLSEWDSFPSSTVEETEALRS